MDLNLKISLGIKFAKYSEESPLRGENFLKTQKLQ
jgi:hypothetical protein